MSFIQINGQIIGNFKRKSYFCRDFSSKMENQYANLIQEFESNIGELIAELKKLREENARLQTELERKQEDLMKAHKDILDLRKEYTVLQTASGMAGSEENRRNSVQHLNKIVREIDKCLALLNE